MKFYKYTISKKGLFRKSFEIFQDDILKYSIKSKGFMAYKHLVFTDKEGQEVLIIKRPFNFFQFSFNFFEKGELSGELIKAKLSNEYTLESIYATYVANGNWLGSEYTIFLGENDIAKISRKMFSNKNKYGVAIAEGNHNLFIIGMIICIEVVKMVRKKKSS